MQLRSVGPIVLNAHYIQMQGLLFLTPMVEQLLLRESFAPDARPFNNFSWIQLCTTRPIVLNARADCSQDPVHLIYC